MAEQQAFFLSKEEIFRKEHPELFERKKRSCSSSKPKKEKIYNCETCKLGSKCNSPKIKRYGKGRKNILLVGLCPGRKEDSSGIPFIGPSGKFLRKQLAIFDIDMDEDCIRTNIVQCFPGLDKYGNDKKPTNDQILSCRPRLLKDIEETKPKLIIAFGTQAIQSLVNTKGLEPFKASNTHGFVFPSQKFQTWIGCSFHPSYFCGRRRDERYERGKDDTIVFTNDLADILAYQEMPLPKPLTEEGNHLITDPNEAIEYIDRIIKEKKPSSHDFEANTYNCYKYGAKLFTVALTNKVESATCIPLWFPKNGKPIFSERDLEKVLDKFREYLRSDVPKVIQNYNMEELWGRNKLGQGMNNFIHDTMVSAHVINCRRETTSLGFQAYHLTGHDYKKMVDAGNLCEELLENIANYNCWDVRYTLMSYYDQLRKLSFDLEKKKFNEWLMGCLPCLANLKDRGILIDTVVMDNLDKEWKEKKKEVENKILSLKGVKELEEKYQKIENNSEWKFNINSGPQVGELIYSVWKEPLTTGKRTKTGRGKTDRDTLLDIFENTKNKEVKEFISLLLKYKKCDDIPKRAKGYRKLLDRNNRVHPSYNMNIAASYRSSASDPNSQNVFNHDEELKIFRKCIIPRKGNIILEVDYSGMEVRGICMMSKDRELTNQLIKADAWAREKPNEPNPWDTHRRWAAKLYQLPIEDITKDQRYNGKNGFVFPSFYGSIPSSIARYEAFRGIIKESHIRRVQDQFWEEYNRVREWQKEQIEYYNNEGCYLGPMGCKRPGPLSLHQLYNNNIQGLSFHLLLDGLQRIDDEMRKRGMKSWAFLEVHDSITFDVVPEEAQEVVDLSTKILCSKRFSWQGDVPLNVEWEKGENWYNKSEKKFEEYGLVVNI